MAKSSATSRPVPANPPSVPSKDLQVFPNPAPKRDLSYTAEDITNKPVF